MVIKKTALKPVVHAETELQLQIHFPKNRDRYFLLTVEQQFNRALVIISVNIFDVNPNKLTN